MIVKGESDHVRLQVERRHRMPEFEDDNDDPWPGYEGQCRACDLFGPVDDLSLCDECAARLERDLIRQRDWDYAAAAFGLSAEGRERLRREVIAQFGAALELVAPDPPPQKQRKRGSSKRKKKSGRKG